jgi:hypothetical protein
MKMVRDFVMVSCASKWDPVVGPRELGNET